MPVFVKGKKGDGDCAREPVPEAIATRSKGLLLLPLVILVGLASDGSGLAGKGIAAANAVIDSPDGEATRSEL